MKEGKQGRARTERWDKEIKEESKAKSKAKSGESKAGRGA